MDLIESNDMNSSKGPSHGAAHIIQAMIDEYNCLIERIIPTQPQRTRKHVKKNFVSFPEKLHLIIMIAPKYDLNHAVSWEIHGRCFHIHNREIFEDTICKNFFGSIKFSSFQRQLSLYGFITLKKIDKGAYYHKKFMRGRFDLCKTMIRQPIKGKRSTSRSSDFRDIESNFYMMPYCMDDNNDDINTVQVTAMGSVEHDRTDTHNVSNTSHVSHNHHLRNDRYDSNIELTDGLITTSECITKGDMNEMSDTTQTLLLLNVPLLHVCHDESMTLLHQHPHRNEGANHRQFSYVSSECRDEGRRNDEPYPIQCLSFMEQANLHHHHHHHRLPHQDLAYVDENEDFLYETAMTQLSMRHADTSRQMQTLYQLQQLKRNLRQEEESPSSLTSRRYAKMPPQVETFTGRAPTVPATMDCTDREDAMAVQLCRSSQLYNGLMDPSGSVNRSTFLTGDGDSCSSSLSGDGSSIITATGISLSDWTLEIPPQRHTPTTRKLVYSESQQHGQPQQLHHSVPSTVSIPECFAGRIFHSLDDDPENDDEISCILANFEVDGT